MPRVGKSEEKPDLESAFPAQSLHIPPPIHHHLPAGCVYAGKRNGIKVVNHDFHKDITRS